MRVVRQFGAMIGSPGDATNEREAVADAIIRWSAHIGSAMDVHLEPIRWETHATPGLQGRPQGMINQELIPQSDLLIAMFRSRAGSPTGLDISGTIEEIREFMQLGKYVVVYFYEGDISIGSVDPDQLRAIQAFRREIQQHGLTESYTSIQELVGKLPHNLTAIMRKLLERSPAENPLNAAATIQNISSSPLPPPKKPPLGGSDASRLIINGSGRWTLLDTHFYEAESVRQTVDGSWTVEIRTSTAEEDAHLASLRPPHFARSRPIAFAHRNEGFLVVVSSIESISEGDHQLWTITLAPEDIEYGGSLMDVRSSFITCFLQVSSARELRA